MSGAQWGLVEAGRPNRFLQEGVDLRLQGSGVCVLGPMREGAVNKNIGVPFTLGVAAVALSCTVLTGPKEEERVGVIDFYDDPVVIIVPEMASVGGPFEVSVRTFGNGCVSRGRTEVEAAGLSVRVTPYDIHSGQKYCTDILRVFEHRAVVTVTEAGVAEILVRGLTKPGDTLVTFAHDVAVE